MVSNRTDGLCSFYSDPEKGKTLWFSTWIFTCDDTGKFIEVDELSGVALVKMADDCDDCCVDGIDQLK